jgi:NADPH2:quinone reductase
MHQTGGPEVLNWTAVDVGEPGSGQVRLRQAAAGLNYVDVYHRTGYYPQPLPFIPGLEGAGTVEAVAPDVRGLKVGDGWPMPVLPAAIPRCGASRLIGW